MERVIKIINFYKHIAPDGPKMLDAYKQRSGNRIVNSQVNYCLVGLRSCMHNSCPREGNREAPIWLKRIHAA